MGPEEARKAFPAAAEEEGTCYGRL
ncbi:hypothetical protein NKH60_03165 [Mesorhizobium sp. M1006]